MLMGKITDKKFNEAFNNLIGQDLGMKLSIGLLPWIKFLEKNRKDFDFLNGKMAEKFVKKDDQGQPVQAFDSEGRDNGFLIKEDKVDEYLKEVSVVMNTVLSEEPSKIKKELLIESPNLKISPVDLFFLEDILE